MYSVIECIMKKTAIFVVRHPVISAFNWQFWRRPRNASVRQLITRWIFWLGKLDTFSNPARFMRSALKLLSWNQGYEIGSCEWTSSLFKLLLHWPKSVVESGRVCLAKQQLFWKELLYERGALHESTWGASNKAGSLYLQHAGKPGYIRLDWSHLTANWPTSPCRTRWMHTVNATQRQLTQQCTS